ncbi:lipopolysaccharide biosynthesis protein [uncultured Clostridium sp.]|jgi:O-antigen/teichoic acid export membrane protein|uniref:lipopolysaccharide biosynthesis protein n=1 Tax=uncultured Clostridium sp. TaxID=59620 RepID=UPI00262B9030|nr:lipopolysaccharide biosynthesis protein [uncultured Clostridium sp.]
MGIINSSFKSFFWNISGAILGFLFQMISAKVLGADKYGQANYYLGYVSTLTIIMCFGLQTYIPKKIEEYPDKKKFFSDVVCTYTVVFLGISCIFGVIGGGLTYIKICIILLAYLTIISELILIYNISTGNASKGMFFRKFLYSLLNLILFLITFFCISKEYYIYIIVMIFSYLLTTTPFLIKNLKGGSYKFRILKESSSYYLIQIIYGIYLGYSKILQKDFGTFETVAVLSISLTLGAIVAMLGDIFAKISMPIFAKAWKEKDFVMLKSTYKQITRLNCYLVLPIALLLLINSERILGVLGKGYLGGGTIFSLIMLSQFINSFTGPNGTLLVMADFTKNEIINGILKLLVSVVIMTLIGSQYTWTIAFSILASEIFVNIIKTLQVKKYINIWPYEQKSFVYILMLTVVEGIILCSIAMISNFWIWIVVNIIVVIGFYVMSFIKSPINSDREMILSYIKKIKVGRW